jgi:hypothetical protein
MQLKNNSIILLILFLAACNTQPVPKIPVTLGNNPALDFTGKGAAAGIMLDSVMGGAGIAIGIAIDKGIAKDIAKSLNQHNPPFNIVENMNVHVKRAAAKNRFKKNYSTAIIVEHYGFKTVRGGDDLVSAWLEISALVGEKKMTLRYPEDFDQVNSASLTSVKESSDQAYALINNATERVVDLLWVRLN